MPRLRSYTTTQGRNMAGARALWRATGLKEEDFKKPIIAVVNSYTQFVPGHVHLKDLGDLVAGEIIKAGGVPREFNTIAVDDGIAMGHDGMLYSLPSRELIADSVESMVQAHKADAMVCISNCDKITPGMLLACMRLNVPTVFVSGGPMEAGKTEINGEIIHLDLVDAMVESANPNNDNQTVKQYEESACPTCGSCSGMFTANSMNCLTEALGLSLPGNGTILATHERRKKLFTDAGKTIMNIVKRYYFNDDFSVLPRKIASFKAFENAMALDIAMGGSTNTILHILAIAQEGKVPFAMSDIDRLSRKVPCLCKVAPATQQYHIEDVHRAGGIMNILGELDKGGHIHRECYTVHSDDIGTAIDKYAIKDIDSSSEIFDLYSSAPGNKKTQTAFSQNSHFTSLDIDRRGGCIRDIEHAYSVDGGLAVLFGNIARDGCIVKTAGVDESILSFTGAAIVFESQDEAVTGILGGKVKKGDVVVIRYEGPKGGPGMQEMLYPTSYIKSMSLGKECALITDGRFSGGTSGLSIGHISPEAASGGLIAIVETGDSISIDIPKRKINVDLSREVIEDRLKAIKQRGFAPVKERHREISGYLKSYAATATSADKGAIRNFNQMEN